MAKTKSQKKKLVSIQPEQQALLRKLPGVDYVMALIASESFFKGIPPKVVVNSIRKVIDRRRQEILNNDPAVNENSVADTQMIEAVKKAVGHAMTPNLRRTINATGVVVHTNLGRSLLAAEVIDKGGHALSPRGEFYSRANIRARLNMRDFLDTMRASGIHSGGPPPLGQREKQARATVRSKI